MNTLANVLTLMIEPAHQILGIPRTDVSDTLMLAIGLQESRFAHRRQLVGAPPRPVGPATGYWQFEQGGGVRGVLTHKASVDRAKHLCQVRDVSPTSSAVWAALEHDDILAAGFARLLLWTDPKPLPTVGDVDGAWTYYIRNWRPGKPHAGTWPGCYARAMDTLA